MNSPAARPKPIGEMLNRPSGPRSLLRRRQLEWMMIERACERLIIAYTHFIDLNPASAVADLFTIDGVWKDGKRRWTGRDEIRAGFRRRERMQRRSRHVATNIAVDVLGPRRAVSTSYYVIWRHDGPIGAVAPSLECAQLMGEYRDRFILTAEGWRFSERTVSVAFRRPSPARRDAAAERSQADPRTAAAADDWGVD